MYHRRKVTVRLTMPEFQRYTAAAAAKTDWQGRPWILSKWIRQALKEQADAQFLGETSEKPLADRSPASIFAARAAPDSTGKPASQRKKNKHARPA